MPSSTDYQKCKTCGWELEGPFSGGCTLTKCRRKNNPGEWNIPDSPKAIIIRNVPESVRRELKAKAAKEGKAMQAVLLELIGKYVKGK